MWSVVTIIALVATARFAHNGDEADPSYVVADEVAGVLLALLWVQQLPTILVAFFGFRILDRVKPLGIRRLERLPVVGVVLDDLAAGCLAGLVVLAIERLWR